MAAAQVKDPELIRWQSLASSSSLTLKAIPIPTVNLTIWCDTSTGVPRPFVPATPRQAVFDSLHSLSHPGIRATQRLITARYVWPHINSDVRTWTRSCLQCQRSKVQRHTITPLSTIATPDARFNQIHLDFVGPLPPSGVFRYLLTCIDRFTRWPEAIPIADITADTVAHAFTRFGVPSTVMTDRGSQFESSLWEKLMQLLGTKRLRTTAYHPISNGLIERFHRQLKASLKAHPTPTNWIDSLPMVLLGIRTALKDDIQCTTAELVYGTTLRLPGEFLDCSQNDNIVDPLSYVAQLKTAMQQLNHPRFVHPVQGMCMLLRQYHHVLMYSFGTMQSASHYSNPTMVHKGTPAQGQILCSGYLKPAYLEPPAEVPRDAAAPSSANMVPPLSPPTLVTFPTPKVSMFIGQHVSTTTTSIRSLVHWMGSTVATVLTLYQSMESILY